MSKSRRAVDGYVFDAVAGTVVLNLVFYSGFTVVIGCVIKVGEEMRLYGQFFV